MSRPSRIMKSYFKVLYFHNFQCKGLLDYSSDEDDEDDEDVDEDEENNSITQIPVPDSCIYTNKNIISVKTGEKTSCVPGLGDGINPPSLVIDSQPELDYALFGYSEHPQITKTGLGQSTSLDEGNSEFSREKESSIAPENQSSELETCRKNDELDHKDLIKSSVQNTGENVIDVFQLQRSNSIVSRDLTFKESPEFDKIESIDNISHEGIQTDSSNSCVSESCEFEPIVISLSKCKSQDNEPTFHEQSLSSSDGFDDEDMDYDSN